MNPHSLRSLLAAATLMGGGWAFCKMAAGQAPVPQPMGTPGVVMRSADELEQLLAPIALYPDALVALILPAATEPEQIAQAVALLDQSSDPSAVDVPSFGDSVKSLAHYPEVLRWLAQNPDWTYAVGDAFVAQSTDVMDAMQRLRAKARASGALVDTPQQQVVVETDYIAIEPAEPDLIFVPVYDPQVVFFSSVSVRRGPPVRFIHSYRAGPWLTHDFDWRHHAVWVGQWNRFDHGHWQQPHFDAPGAHRWQLPPQRVRTQAPQPQAQAVTAPNRTASQAQPAPAMRVPQPSRRMSETPRTEQPSQTQTPSRNPRGYSPAPGTPANPAQAPAVNVPPPQLPAAPPPAGTVAPPVHERPSERQRTPEEEQRREQWMREHQQQQQQSPQPQAPKAQTPPAQNPNPPHRERDRPRESQAAPITVAPAQVVTPQVQSQVQAQQTPRAVIPNAAPQAPAQPQHEPPHNPRGYQHPPQAQPETPPAQPPPQAQKAPEPPKQAPTDSKDGKDDDDRKKERPH